MKSSNNIVNIQHQFGLQNGSGTNGTLQNDKVPSSLVASLPKAGSSQQVHHIGGSSDSPQKVRVKVATPKQPGAVHQPMVVTGGTIPPAPSNNLSGMGHHGIQGQRLIAVPPQTDIKAIGSAQELAQQNLKFQRF